MNTRTVPPNPEGAWPDYFAVMSSRPLHPLYAELDRFLGPPGEACELGCGVGQGVLHFAERGWKVLAVDALEEPLEILRARLSDEAANRVTLQQSFLEELDLPENAFDLVVAGFCLFFVSQDDLPRVWASIVRSIRPGGLFMGQFLGPNDSWAGRGYSAINESEAHEMLNGFEILHWDSVERDGKTVQGTVKHWDVVHAIARKM